MQEIRGAYVCLQINRLTFNCRLHYRYTIDLLCVCFHWTDGQIQKIHWIDSRIHTFVATINVGCKRKYIWRQLPISVTWFESIIDKWILSTVLWPQNYVDVCKVLYAIGERGNAVLSFRANRHYKMRKCRVHKSQNVVAKQWHYAHAVPQHWAHAQRAIHTTYLCAMTELLTHRK